MKNLDIRARVLLVALLPASVIAVLLATFFVLARFGDLNQALHDQEWAHARQIAAASSYGVFSGNGQALKILADSALAERNVVAILITDSRNRRLAYSSKRSDLISTLPPLQGSDEFVVEQDKLMIYSTPIRPPVIPIDDEALGDLVPQPVLERGRVVLVMDRSPLLMNKLRLFATGMSISLLVLTLAALLALRMSRTVSQPLDDLEQAVKRMSEGDFSVHVSTEVGGSLARLVTSLNRMATQLAHSHEEMQGQIVQATEELRRRKEEAERANIAKSRFLAAASHDLRQPMHALGLFVSQLQQQIASPESHQLVSHISESVKALGGLLDGLLDISKLDAGVLTPEPRAFPLSQIFLRLESDFLSAAEAKGLFLRIRPTSFWVHTDPVLLERILLNLMANAIRYTDRGGVLLACRQRGERVRIEVRDSGIGIADEHHEVIFHEFVQLKNPGRNRNQGQGLGLAIVRRLAGLLDLPFELRSEPGRGSVFAIGIPLAAPDVSVPEEAPMQLSTSALEGKVVVAVDDDELVLRSVAGLLESWGCLVLPATDGTQAAARIRRTGLTPNTLLCDYRLEHGEKGTDVICRLREEFGADIPAILVSGDKTPEIMQLAKEMKLPLLHKPVSPPKLRTLLHRTVAQSAEHRPS